MNSIKRILKPICRFFRKQIFLHIGAYRKLKKNKTTGKVVLLDTPIHGNIGDQAIVLAEQEFLAEGCGITEYIEITQSEYICCQKKIGSAMNQKDILLIHGGGFIGTLWKNEEDILIQILEQFSRNRIVIFPQTVFFEDSEYGTNERNKLKDVINSCIDLKIFLRDEKSYIYMTDKMGISKNSCFLVPDIVTYLKPGIQVERQEKVLFCLRSDKEKISDSAIIEKYVAFFEESGLAVVKTDTVVEGKIKKGKRKEAVSHKLMEFAGARLVITDRMHGMLLAAISGTPCIAFDNVSKKVSGAYQWIKYLDYIVFVNENELTTELVQSMLRKNVCQYSNDELVKYYNLMQREIFN